MEKQHTVIIVLEAKPGKEAELKDALEAVAEPSRLESTNIEYRLHQGLENPRQFILYENWQSKEKHLLQFEKPYINKLVNQLEGLLEKPYEAYFAEEIAKSNVLN